MIEWTQVAKGHERASVNGKTLDISAAYVAGTEIVEWTCAIDGATAFTRRSDEPGVVDIKGKLIDMAMED